MTESRVASPDHDRIVALDGLRGFAMLLVYVYHCTFISPTGVVDGFFLTLTSWGWIGMPFFFALSGFLITGILVDTKGTEGYFKNFYARRFLRIFPLYYAVLAFSFWILPWIPNAHSARFAQAAPDQLWYWLYVSNFAIARSHAWRHGIVDVSWSLAIEEQFYLLWPSLIALLPRKQMVRVCIGVMVFALLFRIVLVLGGAHPMYNYVHTLSRMDALAAGSFVAYLMRSPGGIERWLPKARYVFWGSVGALLGILIWTKGDYDHPLAQTLGHGTLAVLSGALVLLAATARRGSRFEAFFRFRPFRTVGKYSYCFYLIHLPVRGAVRDLIYPPSHFLKLFGSALPGQMLFYFLALIPVMGLAYLSFHLFEKRCLAFKRYFERTKREASPLLSETAAAKVA